MSLDQTELNQLRVRVTALENWQANISAAIIQAPATRQVNPLQAQPSNVEGILAKFSVEHQKHIKLENGKIYMAEFVSNERWKELNEVAKANGYHWKKDASNSKNSRWER